MPARRFALAPAREEELADLAESVAEEHLRDGRVDPKSIVSEKRITLSLGCYGSAFDGMLEHRAGRFHIYCNMERCGELTANRARFTLSHELGHYFIDEHRNALASGRSPAHGSRCEYASDNPIEREADHFASNLLLPRSRFLQAAGARRLGLSTIRHLAEQFGASFTSTAIRYVELNVGLCTVIKWTREGFAWKRFSPSTFEAGFRKTIEDASAIPEDSATGRALAGERADESGHFECGSVASAWFPFVRPDSDADTILTEQAISLGSYGVLTLLFPQDGEF
jgi:Zn-dependent peptidase ImmA (M78 family)